jgi:uncharacterized membrane protein YkoI
MFRKTIMALFIIVALSAVIAGAFAISNNKNSSTNIISNTLTPLKNSPSSSNSNLMTSNSNKFNKNSKITFKNDGILFNSHKSLLINTKKEFKIKNNAKRVARHNFNSIRYLNKHKIKHLPKTSVISSVKAQELAAKYIEQPGATAGSPKLVNQNGKEVYIVPVIINSKNVGEIDIDAHNGSNLGGAGGVNN